MIYGTNLAVSRSQAERERLAQRRDLPRRRPRHQNPQSSKTKNADSAPESLGNENRLDLRA